MKKVLLTAMTILSVASASVFGMYGNDSGWIDFLVHGNQMRARMDQFGITIGNGTIKGTVGFKANNGTLGQILLKTEGVKDVYLASTVSAGIGYTSPAFGIGLGYNFNFAYNKKDGINKDIAVHTPVLTLNAMNDNLRIAIPFQIASASSLNNTTTGINAGKNKDYLGLSTEVQIRYYTGIDAFNAMRFYVRYGQVNYKNELLSSTITEYAQSSFGVEGRFYFLNMPVGNVQINPFVKVRYDMALDGNNYEVTASSYNFTHKKGDKLDRNAYKLGVDAVLSITANSDVVSLYVEPSLGYAVADNGAPKGNELDHSLVWGAYGEIYVTPVKDLEWYFEANVGNSAPDNNKFDKVYFESSTGITWYLPSFQE